jgi:hypothetical protein
MERQEILYLLLGAAIGVIFMSLLLLRAPLVSQHAYDLGLREKNTSEEVRMPHQEIQTTKY